MNILRLITCYLLMATNQYYRQWKHPLVRVYSGNVYHHLKNWDRMGKAPEFSSTEPENMKTYITSLSIILQFEEGNLFTTCSLDLRLTPLFDIIRGVRKSKMATKSKNRNSFIRSVMYIYINQLPLIRTHNFAPVRIRFI